FLILFNKDKFKIKEKNLTHKNFVLAALSIFLIAIYGGFFGAGFGFFSIVVLVLLGFSFMKSAAMARVIGFFMSLASTIVFIQNNVINYPFALSLGLGYAIGSWIGIGIAIKKGENYIKSLLIIITILTLFRLLGGFFGFKF
ncbi:MAG: sulfite exporter TauE/SafE family protein, partial [Candidatus Levybacteria bacterium]|nr:sulfite exporter TauE/SafE family protein [Candidatus Levybacteria bacterium]